MDRFAILPCSRSYRPFGVENRVVVVADQPIPGVVLADLVNGNLNLGDPGNGLGAMLQNFVPGNPSLNALPWYEG